MTSLSTTDLQRALDVAAMAADRARVEVLRRFRHAVVELPEFPVVGEEFGGEPPTEGPYWVVDPIDGTISFARGIPLFATLIALIAEGNPVVGLIDLPVLGVETDRHLPLALQVGQERVLGARNADLLPFGESRQESAGRI